MNIFGSFLLSLFWTWNARVSVRCDFKTFERKVWIICSHCIVTGFCVLLLFHSSTSFLLFGGGLFPRVGQVTHWLVPLYIPPYVPPVPLVKRTSMVWGGTPVTLRNTRLARTCLPHDPTGLGNSAGGMDNITAHSIRGDWFNPSPALLWLDGGGRIDPCCRFCHLPPSSLAT